MPCLGPWGYQSDAVENHRGFEVEDNGTTKDGTTKD